MTATGVTEELTEHAKWRAARPEIHHAAERLLRAEFASESELRTMQLEATRKLLTLARRTVPYYRQQSSWVEPHARIDAATDLLQQLRITSKADVQNHFAALAAERLPPSQQGNLVLESSGTTGKPTSVRFNAYRHGLQYSLLIQRHLRWERVDPSWKLAVVRRPSELPREQDGDQLRPGVIRESPQWPYLRGLFRTGSAFVLSHSTPLERQLEVLREQRAEYLVTYPGALERLVLAARGTPSHSLRMLRTISATLTEGMRSRIESATGLRVLQNYGLNELGLVANRCWAGRYHVNSESFVVEIVDDDGNPTPAGERGRIVITGLRNPVMPLIRYDSGDLAEAVEGPCACGRTLPAFGRIHGRYRAMRYTPPRTAERVNRLMAAIEELPWERLHTWRQYQLHQFRDGSFELRLELTADPDPEVLATLRQTWVEAEGEQPDLRIVRVAEIADPTHGKTQEFTSDFFPSIDEGATDVPE